MSDSRAALLEAIPSHLHQFIAEQDYARRYTPQDQAVWRFTLRLLRQQLRHTAHPVYFEGLEKTGITLEHIPFIDTMNLALEKLGWAAVVVDGFIPPQAFMELQQHRVLAIALDMRSIEHILYTPAPDIVHEAAGHAPILADQEYSEYLQRFGEVGVKAMYNRHDLQLYEAVRALSMLKEDRGARLADINAAEAELQRLSTLPVEPSELALLTRLHWWTVEYGLVGDVQNYRLFGAGLLSSLGESEHCLRDDVRKLPLTVAAINSAYDITREQPQLFVTKSCRHLTQVLEEFATTMCYRRGGAEALQMAIDAEVVCSCELSSGLQIAGQVRDMLRNAVGAPIYFTTSGATQLAVAHRELPGQGTAAHPEGFGSPLGAVCNLMKPLEQATEYDLQTLDIVRDGAVRLEFVSGVVVAGLLQHIERADGQIVLMTFSDCEVTSPDGEVLFAPEWGQYDMAVGAAIASVSPGSADKSCFDVYPGKSVHAAQRPALDSAQEQEQALYAEVRLLRESAARDAAAVEELLQRALQQAPDAWLLFLELQELIPGHAAVEAKLQQLSGRCDEWQLLIGRGQKLLEKPAPAA